MCNANSIEQLKSFQVHLEPTVFLVHKDREVLLDRVENAAAPAAPVSPDPAGALDPQGNKADPAPEEARAHLDRRVQTGNLGQEDLLDKVDHRANQDHRDRQVLTDKLEPVDLLDPLVNRESRARGEAQASQVRNLLQRVFAFYVNVVILYEFICSTKISFLKLRDHKTSRVCSHHGRNVLASQRLPVQSHDSLSR